MIEIKDIQAVYFIGIGGIGMSGLARYFNQLGVKVSGYDKTSTNLTDQLIEEGIKIHFEDDVNQANKEADLIIFTPAIPESHTELSYFKKNNYPVKKRAEILGEICKDKFTIAVAGTHGKTTITSMIAHVLREIGVGCTAFIGGITVNYETNFWMDNEKVVVVEADEYDRSFLKLHPDIAVITAVDPDHLDIYGDAASLEKGFDDFVQNINAKEGILVLNQEVADRRVLNPKYYRTYDLNNEKSDYYISNLRADNQRYLADLNIKDKESIELNLSLTGDYNVENVLAAAAVTDVLELDQELVQKALSTFKGIKRRFEYIIQSEELTMIDDYAHHPEELKVLINATKKIYANKKITIIFQPHLFSRTQDFADGFAESLSLADEVVLLDIYPAREKPIKGVTSKLILDKIEKKVPASLLKKEELFLFIKNKDTFEVVLIAGAGDINECVRPIADIFLDKYT